MFIAIGFPDAARETGAVLLYLGLRKDEMLKACDDARDSKKFARVGKLFRPIFQKHPLQVIRHETVDCSPEHNAYLFAERAAIAQGLSPEEAASRAALTKLDACKASLSRAQTNAKKALDAVKNFPPLTDPRQRSAHAALHTKAVADSQAANDAAEAAQKALEAAQADALTKTTTWETNKSELANQTAEETGADPQKPAKPAKPAKAKKEDK